MDTKFRIAYSREALRTRGMVEGELQEAEARYAKALRGSTDEMQAELAIARLKKERMKFRGR